eukprot:4082048-Pleurochrysis_carterae.AAC.1
MDKFDIAMLAVKEEQQLLENTKRMECVKPELKEYSSTTDKKLVPKLLETPANMLENADKLDMYKAVDDGDKVVE